MLRFVRYDPGGHVNMTVLGALQWMRKGKLANWAIPGKMLKGMVGDGSGGQFARVIVAMEHGYEGRSAENPAQCTLPLTVSKWWT